MTARLTVSPLALAAALLPGFAGRADDGVAPGSDPSRYPADPRCRVARRVRLSPSHLLTFGV